ncbi:hypothetical protein M1M87_00555 [Thermodesulfovibrionales bacterium]|nr:hypothetical protein [Thermodesulfovibrionales bacterium]MCL0037809.1 hypothetical protein [Thermodesulfovibrionales bacterium]MCL0039990.1 hypothetical protein [Thermodesulfovibrionales bacterium]MCL0042102.1 hypothetical protein [Thermodesulfovibrionales bacterium]MCL0046734.1 hypothetical protein [Thermodesulfovibrionales bacterium]
MKKEPDFFDKPKNIKILKIIFYISLVVVFIVGFLIPPALFLGMYVPAFYALFGFISCILIIVIAKALGHKWLLRRKEDYYD